MIRGVRHRPRRSRAATAVASCAALALLLGLPQLCHAQDESAEKLYSEAVALHQRGEIESAIAKYQAALAVEPGHVRARSNLGAALVRLGRLEDAVAQYRLALKGDPQNAAIRLNLGLAYYRLADFDKAATEFSTVRAAQPDNRQALYLLADCYLRLGRDAGVIALLEPLDSADPNDGTVAYLLGTALVRSGQLEKGERVIQRIFEHGDAAVANVLLGAAQLAAKDKAAVATLTKALQLNPQLPRVHALLGMAKLDAGDIEGAKASFRAAVDADPNDYDANLHLGGLLNQELKPAEAAPLIDRALRVRPDSVDALFQRASIHETEGKLPEAAKGFQAVVEKSPDFLEAHLHLAAVYFRMGRREDGERERAVVLKLQAEQREREREERSNK